MIIIPAIDIINGQCVRLKQGDYQQQTTYNNSPLQMAKQVETAGFTHIHIVDLDGAKVGSLQQQIIIEEIITNTKLKVDVGGGISTIHIARQILKMGADKINIGSLAVKQPQLFKQMLNQLNPQNIILSADVLEEQVQINGWQQAGQLSIWQLIEQFLPHNLQYVCVTDINKDGTLQGPSITLNNKIQKQYPALKIIASGGIGNLSDVAALQQKQVYGAIVGKAIYENKIQLEELRQLNNA
jgi:phosphoribosylformimino-5-aminoimidazole carboxamide ribotide isomerase